MRKVLIINGFTPNAFSKGELNSELTNRAKQQLEKAGYEVRISTVAEDYNIEEELEKHTWANTVILQTPVNWMGIPWGYKKYMDEVYTAGMSGQLCKMDGRSSEAPTKNYGTGGTLNESKYMLSLTFNAPKEAFNDKSEYLFQGKSVDDLFFSQHMNFRFFGMKALPTFTVYDVHKNPDIENDFTRFEKHINENIINS